MTRTSKTVAQAATAKGIRLKRSTSKKSAGPSASLSTLRKLATTKKKQYLHSDNTTGKYDGYIARAKEWLAAFSKEEHEAESKWKAAPGQGLSAEGEEEFEGSEMEDPEFCHAFEGPPVQGTPQAIAMFLAWKCFSQDNGQGTADGIHAAFLAEYNAM
jgi:hypothetical protein